MAQARHARQASCVRHGAAAAGRRSAATAPTWSPAACRASGRWWRAGWPSRAPGGIVLVGRRGVTPEAAPLLDALRGRAAARSSPRRSTSPTRRALSRAARATARTAVRRCAASSTAPACWPTRRCCSRTRRASRTVFAPKVLGAHAARRADARPMRSTSSCCSRRWPRCSARRGRPTTARPTPSSTCSRASAQSRGLPAPGDQLGRLGRGRRRGRSRRSPSASRRRAWARSRRTQGLQALAARAGTGRDAGRGAAGRLAALRRSTPARGAHARLPERAGRARAPLRRGTRRPRAPRQASLQATAGRGRAEPAPRRCWPPSCASARCARSAWTPPRAIDPRHAARRARARFAAGGGTAQHAGRRARPTAAGDAAVRLSDASTPLTDHLLRELFDAGGRAARPPRRASRRRRFDHRRLDRGPVRRRSRPPACAARLRERNGLT